MNITSRPRSKAASFLGKLLYCSLSVWMLGAVYAPAQASSVTVDQQPLTIQKPLPPNLTLMLDDSGSMAWDFMPDADFLSGHFTATDEFGYRDTYLSADALRNTAVNGTYYNPTVTYTPPVHADGTSFNASASLTNAYIDGINSTGSTDVTQFTSASLCSYNGWFPSPSGCPSSLYYSFPYYTAFPSSGTTYAPTFSCNNSDKVTSINGLQMCLVKSSSPAKYYVPTFSCTKNNDDKYNYGTGYCETGNPSYTYLFTYTQGPAGGTYTRYYVASSSCAGQSNCVLASDTSGAAAPAGVAAGQNIANWFSYYRTRILMAKTGLMNAFSGVNSTFRIGFGSINGRNNSALPTPTFSANGKTIAEVKPFGDGSSSADQKSNFWTWLKGIVPNNSTPLRSALDAVGQYYETDQPWQTSEDDHSELACRQSYTILTTDGFWNGSLSNGPGNADNTAGPTNTGPNGQSYTYKNVAPYADSISNTLADVAMKYWKTDLMSSSTGASNIANEVPPSTDDPAFWQHMTTFTLGLGFTPVGIAPTGTTISQIFNWANGGTPITGFSWPNPTADSINNIADLAHAAVNGHGGFFSATSPQEFLSGVQDALKRATERVGTGASLAANSTQLKTGTVAYQANYFTSKWKGDLKAFAVDSTTGAIFTTTTWTAVTALPAAASRNIWSYNPTASANKQFVAFQNSTSGSGSPPALSSAELSALGGSATAQENMVDYLRGVASREQKNGGSFRNRDTPFGDVVDSQPIFVGAPDPNEFSNETFTGADVFIDYASSNASRAPLIFVAANDGMLHALDAATGAETFVYIPAAVITSGLKQLSDPDYGSSVPHQYFNDGELTVADAYVSGAWHTVAVGTTGRGTAEAVYALDITDPTNIQFLWERAAGDGRTNSNYIGQMTGKPIIAQTADGTWSVLIGNGYNSAAGVAALLQFKLADGTLTVHATTDTSTGNGLAAPAVWLDNPTNGISTKAYAGDLRGQVWSFVLNDGTAGTPSSTGSLLFTAKDAGNKAQPITAGMLAGKDPDTGNVWVFFGTGKYLSTSDLTDLSTQSWYGLIVQSSDSTLVSKLSTGRTALVQRSIVAEVAGNATSNPPVLPARAVTPAPTTPDMTGKSGWYIDLTSPVNGAEGERIATPNQFQGNLLLGITRIPQAVDLCNPSGRGWIMAIDPFTGTNPASNFFDLNGDGLINSSDTITVGGKQVAAAGVGFSSLPNNPIFVGSIMLVSFDNGTTSSLNTSGSSGNLQRVSWRELINQ